MHADVIVIGGGVIGATTAWQLAERGADVLLLERGALASGATAPQPGAAARARPSAAGSAVRRVEPALRRAGRPLRHRLSLDREPVGTLFLATDDAQLELLAGQPRAHGGLLDRDQVLAEEPELAADVAGGLLVASGRRSDPSALTAAAASLARESGARVRCHVEVKALGDGSVLTDEGVERAGTVVLAAGAWSRPLARSAGFELAVRPVRGWLAVTAPVPPLLRHVVYEADYAAPDGPQPGEPVRMADLAAGDLAELGAGSAQASGIHQNADGTIMVGATRSAALRDGDESARALRDCVARACRLMPALAGCEVATTWTGLRPFSPDGLPHIGHLGDRLVVCAGHGSEGILTGAGSGRLAAELALGVLPHTDPAPFAPGR